MWDSLAKPAGQESNLQPAESESAALPFELPASLVYELVKEQRRPSGAHSPVRRRRLQSIQPAAQQKSPHQATPGAGTSGFRV